MLYSVKNKSKLFRMTKTDGIWHSDTTTSAGVAADWADGKEIRFGAGVTSNGTAVTLPDTEGMTQDPAGNIYVTQSAPMTRTSTASTACSSLTRPTPQTR